MKKIFLVLALVLLSLTLLSCDSGDSSSGGEGSHQITYQVTGSASAVFITLLTPGAVTAQFSGVTPPWSVNYTLTSGFFLYISAQNQTSSGSVTVSIYEDGNLLKQSSSSGAFVTATASGTL